MAETIIADNAHSYCAQLQWLVGTSPTFIISTRIQKNHFNDSTVKEDVRGGGEGGEVRGGRIIALKLVFISTYNMAIVTGRYALFSHVSML